MSLEQLQVLVSKGSFYRFNSLEDFDKKIDYNGIKLKGVKFNRGVVDEYKRGGYDCNTNCVPTRYSAYGERR